MKKKKQINTQTERNTIQQKIFVNILNLEDVILEHIASMRTKQKNVDFSKKTDVTLEIRA